MKKTNFKKRKIIFSLTILITLSVIVTSMWRWCFVNNGETLENVVYKSENLIEYIAKEGNGKNLVILGSGYSTSIDEQNRITSHDPLMILPDTTIFSENTTVISIFYPFESSGLEEPAVEIAEFINGLDLEQYENIVLIGHSKCGVHFANAAKWIEEELIICTISAPFYGTPIVEPQFQENLNPVVGTVYSVIFSNHNVDKDISPTSTFMENVDYTGLEKHTHINVISTCPNESLNPIDMFLIHLDEQGIDGDGIVSKKSQQLALERTITIEIEATHATSLQKGIEAIKVYIPDL